MDANEYTKPSPLKSDHRDISLMNGDQFLKYVKRLITYNSPTEIRVGSREFSMLEVEANKIHAPTKDDAKYLTGFTISKIPVVEVPVESHLSLVTPEGIL